MANHAGPEAVSAGARVLALAGPTASGKSAAALAIAQEHDAEIISVDSALVYRGMDIGTAKPSPAERGSVPHHLIDIRDPLQAYSAAEFAADAQRLVARSMRAASWRCWWAAPCCTSRPCSRAWMRCRRPTAPPAPKWKPRPRQKAGRPCTRNWRWSIPPRRRGSRPMTRSGSSARWKCSGCRAGRSPASISARRNAPALGATPLFSLEPQDRAWLHERIARRFDDMLAGGFLEEVKTLRARGDLTPDLPSMRCVGYRQAWEALDGLWPMRRSCATRASSPPASSPSAN